MLRWLAVIAAVAALAASLLSPGRGRPGEHRRPHPAQEGAGHPGRRQVRRQEAGRRPQRANDALDQAENELAQAEQLRLDAHARGVRATAALADATKRVRRLRRILGDRARGIYIGGDPAGLAALVQSGKADQLLGQVAILDHLAKESNDSLADLIVAQKDYALARSILAEAEVDARKAGAEISRKIDQATWSCATSGCRPRTPWTTRSGSWRARPGCCG